MSGEENNKEIARKHPGSENLDPCRTTEVARERGRKGGLAKKGSVHLQKYMEQMFFAKFPVLVDGKKITWGKAINMKWFDKAAKGDMRAIQEFNDRFLGKAKQEIDARIQQAQQEEIIVRFEGPPLKEGE